MPQRITLKEAYSVIIGLLPLIMMYKVPFWGVGLSTAALGFFAPYVIIAFFQGRPRNSWQLILPALFCFGYLIFRSIGDLSTMFLMFITLIHVVGASQNTLDFKVLKKTIIYASLITSICVFFQTVIWYILGIDIKFSLPTFIIDKMKIYFVDLGVNGLYRPAGLFAEPSHMTQYTSLALALLLFPENSAPLKKSDMKKSLIIILGVLFTTSGMGMVFCAGTVIVYIFMNTLKLDISRRLPTFVAYLFGVAVFALIALQIPLFSQAFERIIGEVDGYNAVWGRTLYYETTIGSLNGTELLLGRGIDSIIELGDAYLTTYMALVYQYGWIGYGLLLLVFLVPFFKAGKSWHIKYICAAYVGFTFVSNQSGFINLCFWLCAVYTAICEKDLPAKDYTDDTDEIAEYVPYARKVAKETEVGSYVRETAVSRRKQGLD